VLLTISGACGGGGHDGSNTTSKCTDAGSEGLEIIQSKVMTKCRIHHQKLDLFCYRGILEDYIKIQIYLLKNVFGFQDIQNDKFSNLYTRKLIEQHMVKEGVKMC
jgi:hypothetical protein